MDEQKIKMVVNYFNAIAGTRCAPDRTNNIEWCKRIFEVEEDAQVIRNEMKKWIAENPENKNKGFVGFAKHFIFELDREPKKEIAPVAEAPKATVDGSLDFLSKVVSGILAQTKTEEIKEAVVESSMAMVKEFINKEYGPIQRKVVLDLGGEKIPMEGVVHEKFDTILKFVKANEPVFLTGAAGTGKNFLCQQVAKALGLDFYFSNAVTQEYKITGFTDAMGTFHESQFFKAFKYGGLFMLDEMDASIPEVLIILNAAIANRYFDFPAPIGYVAAHPDFRVIAAGNTFGNGADYDYVGRNQLDAASLDRFAMVRVDYDARIEEAMACGNTELLNFCRQFRKAVNTAGIRTVVSYRAISRMAKLDASMKPAELIDTCLVKSLEVDDLNSIKDQMEGFGKYTEGFKKVISLRKKEGK